MEIFEEESFQLIGGSTVNVRLVEMPNWDSPPNMEISTRFYYPVEGKGIEWGYATVLSDFLELEYMKQEFRQEVARWVRLKSHG